MTKQVESAFTRFFREKNSFPKLKSKKNPIQSFPIPKHYNVYFENDTIKLPKIWEIKAVLHKTSARELKIAIIPKSCTKRNTISAF